MVTRDSRFKKILWDGHAVFGAIASLLLFIIFYAGAFTLYRGELQTWSDPALRATSNPPSLDEALEPLFEEFPPDPGEPLLVVHPFAGRPYIFVRYVSDGDMLERRVGARSGVATHRNGRSRLPDLLHDLHYFRQFGIVGRTLSGVVSVVFVFILISGLVLHFDKLIRNLHAFRVRHGLRVAVTDAHNTLGVLTLPFTAMYALTGAFFGLLLLILSPTVLLLFDGDSEALDAHLSGVEVPVRNASLDPIPSPTMSVGTAADQVRERWGPDTVLFRTDVTAWNDRNSHIIMSGTEAGTLAASGKLVMSATTGAVIREVRPEDVNVLGATVSVITNLHFARLGSNGVDAIFFLLALLASSVFLTGNILWLFGRVSQDMAGPKRRDGWLGRATVGVSVGLVWVVPLSFIVSRCLPLEWPPRTSVETGVFFIGWGLALAASFIVRDVLALGSRMLLMAAFVSFLVPIADILMSALDGVVSLQSTLEPAVLTVNIGFWISAALLLTVFRKPFSIR